MLQPNVTVSGQPDWISQPSSLGTIEILMLLDLLLWLLSLKQPTDLSSTFRASNSFYSGRRELKLLLLLLTSHNNVLQKL